MDERWHAIFDEMEGDIANFTEITKDERDRQMRHYAEHAHHGNYLRAACVHWKKVLRQVEEATNEDRLRARLTWSLVSDNRFFDHIPSMVCRFPLPGSKSMNGLPPKFQHRFVLDLTEIGIRANATFPKYEDVLEKFCIQPVLFGLVLKLAW